VPLQSREPRILPARPFSGPAPQEEPCRSRACGCASPGVLAPTDTFYVGCPFSDTRHLSEARVGRGSPDPRRCRPQGSYPSRRFRLARGAFRSLATPSVCRGPRRFAALFHAAGVPGASLQSFPFPRSRTRSRGPSASLRVRVRLSPAQRPLELRDRFRPWSRLFAHSSPPGGGPGLMSRDQGSLRPLVRSPRRTR